MVQVLRWILVAAVAYGLGCTAVAGLTDFEVVADGGMGGGTGGAGGGGTGGTVGGGGAGGTGGGPECTSSTDCDGTDTTCRYRTCDNGVCGMANASQGTTCTDSGELCDGDGNCVWSDGQPCTGGAQCLSGHCADDVCCDDACDALCEACVAAKTGGADGECLPIPPLADPDSECTQPAQGCDGNGACLACGAALTPAGGACPGVCHSCTADTCVFDCDTDNECQVTIDCPAGWHCLVNCTGNRACETATVNCANGYACDVVCSDSQHKCENLQLNCSAKGPCSMDCQGGDTCRNSIVNCGANACTATCVGNEYPTLNNCGSSCQCVTC